MTGKRILLVDDEDDIREVAQLSLETIAGWEVLSVRSGREALAHTQSGEFDVILLDVMMPEMDGLATFELLQANDSSKAIPMIFLTAKVQVSDRRRFEEMGVAGIIAKPFDPLVLADQIKDCLGWGK